MKHLLTTIFLFSLYSTVFANSDFTIGKWYTAFNDEAWHCSVRFGENKTVEFSEGIDYPFGHDFWDKYTATGSKGMYEIVLDNGMKFNALVSRHYLVLYEQEKTEPFFIGGVGISVEAIGLTDTFEASSFLTEKNKSYKPENLKNLNLDSPWVEGAKGYGIGEKITFKTYLGFGIAFFSGYISFRNPSLYEKNARIKKLRLTCVETKNFIEVSLEDTAGGQQIDLSDLFQDEKRGGMTIQMEILDVYKGTKYADTCINSMFVGFSRLE